MDLQLHDICISARFNFIETLKSRNFAHRFIFAYTFAFCTKLNTDRQGWFSFSTNQTNLIKNGKSFFLARHGHDLVGEFFFGLRNKFDCRKYLYLSTMRTGGLIYCEWQRYPRPWPNWFTSLLRYSSKVANKSISSSHCLYNVWKSHCTMLNH